MKLVINKCFGGFSLSPRAIKRMAELNGRECYFFRNVGPNGQISLHKNWPVTLKELEKERCSLFFHAYDIPNPDEILPSNEKWHEMSLEERTLSNKVYENHSLDSRPDDRADPKLIQVVEELGEKANGGCADLQIIEIPDGVDYVIDEYDGNESVHEKHQVWG